MTEMLSIVYVETLFMCIVKYEYSFDTIEIMYLCNAHKFKH